MSRIIKFLTIIIFSFSIFSISKPQVLKADLLDTKIEKIYSASELINIVNPYIKETFRAYTIENKEELIAKIGFKNYQSLEKRIIEANKRKAKSLNRDAISIDHFFILHKAGAKIESHWWGTRLKTDSRDVAIKVRNLAHGFSGDSGRQGLISSLIVSGLSKIPVIGNLIEAVGLIHNLIIYADSKTWSDVAYKVGLKIDEAKYNLTIDINQWILDVRVY